MKKIIALFILLSVLFSFAINISAQGSFSWYLVRNKENKQPTTDPRFNFVEKYSGYYVNKSYTEKSNDKVIYLTFDAGYSNENLESILKTLKEENVTAAFFILSNLIIKSPDVVRQMENDGHFVCNHTSKHLDISKANNNEIKAEINKLEELYLSLTGKEMKKYFRPPEGRFSEESLRYIDELGYKTVFWSFAYEDWDNEKQPSPKKAKEKIFSNLHNGEIMLLHPTSKTNADILKDVIKELKDQGYRFGTLDEL